ncbi:efflux RND transporter periplasmic adaptor subunit [Sphingobacterium sp.]|uniref:efflux RND transporter periplasmic adaptor subunit n=1 Tax=Sphingobacterium sp. TaxID=341027 RepID=UPI00289C605E|nr:efflux RND transporter periplasmic adaptor subunit [Sphingobacterium sp.]
MKKLLVLCLFVGMVGMLDSCRSTNANADQKEEIKNIPITPLIVMDTTVYQEYIADIQASKNVEVRSKLNGFLDKIYVDEGAWVKKGQTLFKYNNEEYRSELAKAKAQYDNSIAEMQKIKLEMERTQKLVDKNIVSSSEYNLLKIQLKAANSKIEEARALVNQAQTRLDYTVIQAPFDGRIDRILLKEGSLLTEGSLITTISDLSKVNVYFDISEREYLALMRDKLNGKETQKSVKLILANGELYPHEGIAHLVESEFEANTGSIALRVQFPNAEHILKHGATGKIAVPMETGEHTFVHQKSVFEIQDKTYVYTMQADSTVKMTPFVAGPRVGHYYIVESGLDPNAKVVYEGVQNLRSGVKINPKLRKL